MESVRCRNGVAAPVKILCSAYACEPGAGSEPGVGWNIARALARSNDVWVLTRSNNRGPIEAELAVEPVPTLHFEYFDLPGWARWWKRGARGLRTYYRLWQLAAAPVAGRLDRRVEFDVAQHVTFAQYWTPSLLRGLGIPYVWGPVGGGDAAPPGLRGAMEPRARLAAALRPLALAVAERDPAVRDTARSCAIALASTPRTANRLHALGAEHVRVLNQAALGEADLTLIRPDLDDGRETSFRIVSVTNLAGRKGVELGLRAFIAADVAGARYIVIGDGPARPRLERLAREASVADRIEFRGALPREEVLQQLSGFDAFLHLSLTESGSFACLEAMAAGLPIVHLNHGGPSVLVPETAGVGVAVNTLAHVVAAAAAALSELASNPERCARMGRAGRRHVLESGTWEARVAELVPILESLAGTH